ncbi:MAG: DegV family protein [Anaerolineales bacterium]|jgi:DegV family protein with EDD domain
MLRIVTDSTADMPPGWEQEYELQVVPLNIHLDEKTYLQGVELSNEDFYRLVEQSGKIPTTSQPTPYQFKEFYRRIAHRGDTILSLHVTSKLSGTYDSAVSAARELQAEYRILPFDSGCGSAGLGMMCREARVMERAGATVERILERWEQIRQQVQIVLTLDKLDYARKSGRVGTLQAALASALNVKPIVELQQGILEMTERARTRTKAFGRVLDLVHNRFLHQPLDLAVVHARDPEAAQILEQKARPLLNIHDLIMTELSISVAANLGPGTVGVVAYPAGA